MDHISSGPALCLLPGAGAVRRHCFTVSPRSKSTFSNVILPASIFEKSRMSLMMDNRQSALILMVLANSRCSGARGVSSNRFDHADDAVHGGADFMAHVGEEFAFGLAGDERGLGHFLRFFLRDRQQFIGGTPVRRWWLPVRRCGHEPFSPDHPTGVWPDDRAAISPSWKWPVATLRCCRTAFSE